MNATHELCPEERHSIGTTSVQYAHWFLKEMSDEVNQVITAICEEQCMLNYKLLPKHSAASILQSSNKHKKNKDKKKQVGPEEEKPGTESVRKNRENFTRYSVLGSWNLTTCMWAMIPGRSWWLKILCSFWKVCLTDRISFMKIKDLQNIYMVFDILHWNLFSLFTVPVDWISMWLSQIESLIDKFFTIQFSDCHNSIQENLLIRKCLWHMTRYEDVGKIITSL